MKVFVSSTCYDLLDLRAELHRDLRDLGVEACFSDLKESDFETCGQPGQNSIETCLANVKDSELVIFVLSQRYGALLKEYDFLSATHVEYRTAVAEKKRIFFYVRDRLASDWSGWKKHGKPDNYPSSWAVEGRDANGLFGLIQEHQKLQGRGEVLGTNNWFWPFTNSVDLRADIRKRIAKEAFIGTGKQMAEKGLAPILVVVGQQVEQVSDGQNRLYTRFSLHIANGGTMPAIGVCCRIEIENTGVWSLEGSKIGLIIPGDDPASRVARTAQVEIPTESIREAFANDREKRTDLPIWFIAGYRTASGHMMEDRTLLTIRQRDNAIEPCTLPTYDRKSVTGMVPLVG